MFTLKKQTSPSYLDLVVDAHLTAMSHLPKSSPEYAKMVDQLVKIQPLRTPPKERKPLDPNVLLTLAANLVMAGMVVEYEKIGLVTSKVFGMISKIQS